MNETTPVQCPYCGSIENDGYTCNWCHNYITEKPYISEMEEKEMLEIKVTIESADLAGAINNLAAAIAGGSTKNVRNQTAEPISASSPTPPVAQPVVPTMPIAATAPAAPANPVNAVVPTIPTAPTTAVATANVPSPVPIPTAVKVYTLDELALAARPIVEAGRQQEIAALVASFTYIDPNGVPRPAHGLNEIPPEQYPALANALRQMGGKI